MRTPPNTPVLAGRQPARNSRQRKIRRWTSHRPPPDTSTDECHTTHGYITDKDRYLARLKRIEGQARGIQRMVDEEQYCIDILTQISALTSALRNVGLGLLDDHLKHCVVDAAKHGGEAADTKIKEATDAIARLVRS
ncbi:metal-sensitive transcriptional regulator [Brevibacterium antiquum]